jgi:hypothetical protein
MTEKELIVETIKADHQVVMDATIWVYKLGFMAQDDDGKYTVLVEHFDEHGMCSELEEVGVFETPEEAADKYLELVNEYNGQS